MLNVVKTSSMKVNINEGDDEDAFELLRGETAHFDISCRQRGRGRHLLSEGLSPKVGRIEGAQLGLLLVAFLLRVAPPSSGNIFRAALTQTAEDVLV